MIKRALFIVGIIVFVILVAFGIYWFFFRPVFTPPAPQPSQEGAIGQLPQGTGQGTAPAATIGGTLTPPLPAPDQAPTPTDGFTLAPIASLNPALDPTTGGIRYYNQGDGKFYTTTPQGVTTPLADDTFFNVSSTTWSPTQNSAILEFPDGANIYYDFQTKSQVTLPKHWESFSFASDGSQIGFKSIGQDPDNRWLAIANPDGSESRALEALGENGNRVAVNWSPTKQIVATYTEALDGGRQGLYFLGLNNENFARVVIPGFGYQGTWSTRGSKLTFSVWDPGSDMTPNLWIVDAAPDTIGQNRRNLNIKTLASKCAFSSDTEIICAVPSSTPPGSGAYPELLNDIPDSVVRINTVTGGQTLITPSLSYSASKIIVDPTTSAVFAVNSNTGEVKNITP